ncbi:hypothetical protein EM20IM_00300 [Candidatus Methylacidiphilum infernorum]|nr:hypothetical protein [Candidatus Methylacidiphilum infernorum]QSR86851.1 hypothetical protein EM20IM_00300 [Candidatus Methylacidiphilum infernorum]
MNAKASSSLLFGYVSFPLFLSFLSLRGKTTSDVVYFLTHGLFFIATKSLDQLGGYLDFLLQDFSTMLERGIREFGGHTK